MYEQAIAQIARPGERATERYLALLRAEAAQRQHVPGRQTLAMAADRDDAAPLRAHGDGAPRVPGRQTRVRAPAEPTPARALRLAPRFRAAEDQAHDEVVALALDAFAAGHLSHEALGSLLPAKPEPRQPPAPVAWALPPALFDWFAGGERQAAPDPLFAVPAGEAALRDVGNRRAVTIYRHELAGGDADLGDPAVEQALARTRRGEPLPTAVLDDMQARFGADFRHVRIHLDSTAARAAEALHANAFTLGEDIFFAAGAFAPSGEVGQRLLVHELAHVVQAQQGRVPTAQHTAVSRPDDALEQEAAAVYDRSPRAAHAPSDSPSAAPARAPAATHAPAPRGAAQPAPQLVLRDPDKPAAAKPGSNVPPWLSWDQQLIVGFIQGARRAGGKGLDPAGLAKMEAELKKPENLLAVYEAIGPGMGAGARQSISDNVHGLAEIAKWIFWNLPPVKEATDAYELLTDPKGKLAREQEAAERRNALLMGMAKLVIAIAKDPSIIADLGAELGEAAGEYVITAGNNFAAASPSAKGGMIGKGIGYVAVELALLFVGPETLVVKLPAAILKLGRAGGRAAEALIRLMKTIPELGKLLEAAGLLGKAAEVVGPEAKVLSHLDAAIVKKVMQEGLKPEALAELAKLDKVAAEKLLHDLPAQEVLDLEQKLGKAELEKLAKTKTPKEIQEIARTPAAKPAFSMADAEKLVGESEGRPGPGSNIGHAEDHLPRAGATDQEAKLLAESRPNKANTTVFRSRRQATQALRDIVNENRAAIDALPADGVTAADGTKTLSPPLQGFNSSLGQPASDANIRSVTWRIVRLTDGELHLLHFAPSKL